MELEHLNFYGLKISTFQMGDLDKFIHKSFKLKEGIVCYGYSLGILPGFIKYPKLFHISNESDLILTDGRWLYNLLRIKGFQIPVNLSIPDFVFYVLDLAEKLRLNLFLFGASEENNKRACLRIKALYPNIKVFGHSGYFDINYENEIVKLISNLDINLVLIGLPSPQKEEFSFKYRKQLNVSMIIPCGGMIDVLSGKIKPCPSWLKKAGFASFYRVLQEPRRLLKKKLKEFIIISFYILPIVSFNLVIRNSKFSIPKLLGVKNRRIENSDW